MPFDRSKYPKNWKEISQRIKEREGWKCKECGIAHGHYAIRFTDPSLDESRPTLEEATSVAGEAAFCTGVYPKVSKVILTVAHLDDPDPMNCADENLAALCQRCHNRLDMPMRQANARKTRAVKKGQGSLELEVSA